MERKHVKWVVLVLSMAAAAALFPAASQSRPPESDGSTYTWTGAATLTVDVKPWGGGYVRSDPYLIDCPFACIRSFDAGREVKLTAYMTPGHTFKAWEGACAGQGNPCTIKVSGAMDVTAVLEGQYVPPAPPAPPKPPAARKPVAERRRPGRRLQSDVLHDGCSPARATTEQLDRHHVLGRHSDRRLGHRFGCCDERRQRGVVTGVSTTTATTAAGTPARSRWTSRQPTPRERLQRLTCRRHRPGRRNNGERPAEEPWGGLLDRIGGRCRRGCVRATIRGVGRTRGSLLGVAGGAAAAISALPARRSRRTRAPRGDRDHRPRCGEALLRRPADVRHDRARERGPRHGARPVPARPAGARAARRRPDRDRDEQRPLDDGGDARARRRT